MYWLLPLAPVVFAGRPIGGLGADASPVSSSVAEPSVENAAEAEAEDKTLPTVFK